MHSALYFGEVMHARLRPVRHRFVYRVVSLYIDLDEREVLARRLRLLGIGRNRVFGFLERDHGPRDGTPLRPWIDAQLAEAGVDLDGGAVRLLCFPRLWCQVFNPLTVWFCFHRDGGLRAPLYEVSNTFGEHHHYLIPVPAGTNADGVIRQSCGKAFYVSPFLPEAARYHFRLRVPDARLRLGIQHRAEAGDVLIAAQSGRRRDLTDRNLLRAVVQHPLMNVKVFAGIHWEALRLWRKGARFHRRPAPPPAPVTIVSSANEAAE